MQHIKQNESTWHAGYSSSQIISGKGKLVIYDYLCNKAPFQAQYAMAAVFRNLLISGNLECF